MKVDRVFLVLGLLWLLGGMVLGMVMGESGDHSQLPTHAHAMLVGGVLSILWAMIYRLWAVPQGVVAWVHLILHQAAAGLMVYALYGLYGGGNPEQYGPIVGVGGLAIILSVILMILQVFRAKA